MGPCFRIHLFILVCSGFLVLAACGEEPSTGTDGGSDASVDGGADAGADASVDGGSDAGADGGEPAENACPEGFGAQEFTREVVGCQGQVAYPGRAFCNEGWSVCTAAQWRAVVAEVDTPTHHYWVDDYLYYGGLDTDDCWVTDNPAFPDATECESYSGEPDEPMRVCGSDVEDPLGNVCNWFNCGWETANPSERFGGCEGNTTAGTLCCLRVP